MNRFCLFLILIFIWCAQVAVAQSDSLQVVKARWEKKRLARGVKWKTYHFQNTLFNSSQNVNILEVKPRRRMWLDLGFEPQVLKPTSEFGRQAQALAALNGTFFDIKNGGSVDFIRADGQVISPSQYNKNGQRALHQKAAVVFKAGKISLAKWDNTPNWENQLNGEDVMVTGPLLQLANRSEVLDSSSFNRTRHPRTALALTRRNRVLLITVDGRSPNAAGMRMDELSKLTRWLGAKDAINLDGGGSTTLWLKDLPATGVANYPTDNKQWDHAGERKVANVILVRKGRKKSK